MSLTPRLLFLAFALLAAPTASAGEAKVSRDGTRAVVELFTSQGCSSCPPADKLLGELAGEQGIVALSLPVDYWDYLGWHDTLALPSHAQRQKAYAKARGDRSVYTPQVVVNGVTQVVGSDRDAIERAIATSEHKRGPAIPVSLRYQNDTVEVEVGAGSGPKATVWLLAVTCETPVKIGRGENRGKHITYFNAVRAWRAIGEWDGAPLHAKVPVAELTKNGADGLAVLVQPGPSEQPGTIRGAAFLEFK